MFRKSATTNTIDTYLEVILAEDLVKQIKHFEFHASDLVVLLRAFGSGLIDHLVHGILPVLILGWLRDGQRE